ncbi:MAG TPA: hypothetical protein VN231_07895 [Allosphingosinicella sp.]|nr:hypothetical protein [Allosphingosinicella sp.]
MSEKETTGEAAKPAAKSGGKGAAGAAAFAYKAMATTVGGSLLTLGVAFAQITYSNHLESLHRQSEHGIGFQSRLLEQTGRIQNELTNIVDILRRADTPEPDVRAGLVAEAERRWNENLDPLFQRWRLDRLLLRNRGAQIYGRGVGELIYSLGDERFRADSCNVVGLDGPAPPADCAGAIARERAFLDDFLTEIRRSGGLEPFRSGTRSPISFQANAAIARMILYRFIACASSEGEADRPSRCSNPQDGLQIAVRRTELVGIARENLAEAIMERSSFE